MRPASSTVDGGRRRPAAAPTGCARADLVFPGDYLDDSNVQYPETIDTIHYLCNGTALNTFQVGPLFAAGVPGYTFYQFTNYSG